MTLPTFSRLWQQAYDRELDVAREAARLAGGGSPLPLVELVRTARALVRAAADLDDASCRADPAAARRHARRRALQYLIEAAP